MPDRRETLSWLLRVLALSAAPCAHGGNASAAKPHPAPRPGPLAGEAPVRGGYGRDPDLLHPRVTWPLTLAAGPKIAVARLADVFLPAHGSSPAASALAVPEFIDEWVSAPYPQQRQDGAVLLAGLAELERDVGGALQALTEAQARDWVATLHARAVAGAASAVRFFSRFRQICLIGYYTTPVGVAELGYVGYQPSARFAGPPAAVLARLGV